MAMVETAIRNSARSGSWRSRKSGGRGSVEAVHFFNRVRPNAAGVPLKYDFPSSVMDDLEIY